MLKAVLHIVFVILLSTSFFGCATYYDKTRMAEKALRNGEYNRAADVYEKSKFLTRKRNTLLYYLEMGRIANLQGKFEESNRFLNIADDLMGTYRNFFDMALAVTVNPIMQSYKAEGHEEILVHYYKALNYMQMGLIEDAIVEARRIDLTQAKNADAVNGKFKKYGQDPFGLMLMGMLYEADKDYNNAFIAYRNAKTAYQNDETGIYRSNYPHTLEQDLVRAAKFAGIYYESIHTLVPVPNGEVIVFWENGLAPIKQEKNLFFSLIKKDGMFFFVSGDIIIPISYNFEEKDKDFKPSDIGIVRVAWAYYVQRPLNAKFATVKINGGPTQNLQLVEDISALAFQIEKDNYFKELGENVLRLALKKISELAIADKNEYAGLALSVANAASEKADTRNWQSLPSAIHYTRIPLEKGMNKIEITTSNGQKFTHEVMGIGKTVFRNAVTY